MSEEKKRWKWWQKAGLGTVLLFITLVAVLLGLRKPWIRPLPGVRVEMTRPFVKESELGPESAYCLLLQAIEEPTEAKSPPDSLRVWRRDWTDVLTKLAVHPWPATPPPPAPAPPGPEATPEEEDDDDPVLAPLGNEGSGGSGNLALGLLPDHPALAPAAPWTLEQYQDIQRLVRLHEPNMALLDMALAAPDPQVPTEDSIDVSRTYLQEVRVMAWLLSASAQYRAATGDYPGSRRDLVRAVRMGNLICRGGGLVQHLTGIACQAVAATAAWTTASRHDLPAAVLKQTAGDFLASADAAEPFAEGVRAEALLTRSTLRSAYRQAILGSAGGAGAPSSAIPASRIGIFLARLADSGPEDTQRNLTAYYQHMLVFAEKPYSAAVQRGYEDFTRQLEATMRNPMLVVIRTKDPTGLILASMLDPIRKGRSVLRISRFCACGSLNVCT
jgi:hypothetical protein